MIANTPVLKYNEARSLIQDGDILSFKPKTKEFLKQITCFVTRTKYYHTGIAVWLKPVIGEKRLFVIEAHAGGRRLIPMSMYDNSIIDVSVCPINFDTVSAAVLEKVGKVPYSYFDFIFIGLKEMIGLPSKDYTGEVCSEFAAKTLRDGGFNIENTEVSPGKLDAILQARGVMRRVFIRP